jgi:hypothetical protein
MQEEIMVRIKGKDVEAANRRGEARKAAYPLVVAVRYDRRIARIVIALDTGLELALAPSGVQDFEHAHPASFGVPEISPSGLSVHFPGIDVDLYVPGLIEGFLGSRPWMAAQNGKVG